MKLIYAIVRSDNEDEVSLALNKAGFMFTKLSSTGGFLRKGNAILMIGTADDKVDDVIGVIKSECGSRQKIKVDVPFMTGSGYINYACVPKEIEVGGAIIFVTDVARFEHF